MKMLIIACCMSLAATWSFPVMAQYVGPQGRPSSVKDIRSLPGDDYLVVLSGHITRRVVGDLYEFSDGTGTIYLDMDHDKDHGWVRWPAGPVDQHTLVEVYGKYIHKTMGYSKIKVIDMRILGKDAPVAK